MTDKWRREAIRALSDERARILMPRQWAHTIGTPMATELERVRTAHEAIRTRDNLYRSAVHELRTAVIAARTAGCTWQQIADAMGVTRARAHAIGKQGR